MSVRTTFSFGFFFFGIQVFTFICLSYIVESSTHICVCALIVGNKMFHSVPLCTQDVSYTRVYLISSNRTKIKQYFSQKQWKMSFVILATSIEKYSEFVFNTTFFFSTRNNRLYCVSGVGRCVNVKNFDGKNIVVYLYYTLGAIRKIDVFHVRCNQWILANADEHSSFANLGEIDSPH